MAKTARVVVRIRPEKKNKAEALFAKENLSMSDAINLFLYQSMRENKLPFEVEGDIRKILKEF